MPKPAKSKPNIPRTSLLEVLRAQSTPISPEQLFAQSGYQAYFEANDFRQEIVEEFYEELSALIGPLGPVIQTRPQPDVISLEVRP